MNWRPRSSTVSEASRGASATEAEYMELVNDSGEVVATFSESADGTVTMAVDGQPKVYRALLTQSGTDAPVATVLENTLGGGITWARNDAGAYNGTSTGGILPIDKTFCMPVGNVPILQPDNDQIRLASLKFEDADTISLKSGVFTEVPNVELGDGLLQSAAVSILVYP